MENEAQNKQEDQIPTPPPNTPPTHNSRVNIYIMLLTAIIMLGVGLGRGYLLFANKNDGSSQRNNIQKAQILPTVVPNSLSPQAQLCYKVVLG